MQVDFFPGASRSKVQPDRQTLAKDPKHRSHLRSAYNSALQNCGTDKQVLV